MGRKNRNSRFDLPPLELKCMKALWALDQATVHEVRSRLLPERRLAYTTVMTVMDRLARKGVVEREKRGRAHVYRATVAEELVRDRALDRLMEDFFRGSREQLRKYLKIPEGRAARAVSASPKETAHPGPRTAARPAAKAAFETGLDTTLL